MLQVREEQGVGQLCSSLLILTITLAALVKYMLWTNFRHQRFYVEETLMVLMGILRERSVFLCLQMRKPRWKDCSSCLELARKVGQPGFKQVLFDYSVHRCALVEISSSVCLMYMRFL